SVRRLEGSEEQAVVALPAGSLIPVLLHLERAQKARPDHRAGLSRAGAVEHRIERIAVLGPCRWNESPVVGVMQSERHRTPRRAPLELRLELQLRPRARWRLDHDQHTLLRAGRQTD